MKITSIFTFVWLLLFVSIVFYPWWLILQSVELVLIIQSLTVLVLLLSYIYFHRKLKGFSLTFNIELRRILIVLALGIIYLLANITTLHYPFMNTDEDFEVLSAVLLRVPLDLLSQKIGLPPQVFYITAFFFVLLLFAGCFLFIRRFRLQNKVHKVMFFVVPLILVSMYTLVVFSLFHLFQPNLLPDFHLSNIGWLVKYPEFGGILNCIVLLLDFDFLISIRIVQFVFVFLALIFFYRLLRLFVGRQFSVMGTALLALNPLFFMSASLGVKVGCVSFVMISSSYFLLRYFSGEGKKRIVFFYLSMFLLVIGILFKEPIILFSFFCLGISAFYVIYSELRSCKRACSHTNLFTFLFKRLSEKIRTNKPVILFSALVVLLAVRRQVIQDRFLGLTLSGGYKLFPSQLFNHEVYSKMYKLSEIFLGARQLSFLFIILTVVMLIMFFRTSKFKYLFIPAWAIAFFFFTLTTRFAYDFKSMLFYVPPLIVILVVGVSFICSLPWWRKLGKFAGLALLFVYLLFIASQSFEHNFVDRTLDIYTISEYYHYISSPKFENSSIVQLFPMFYVYEYYVYPGMVNIDHDFISRNRLDSLDNGFDDKKCSYVIERLKSEDVDYISLLIKGTNTFISTGIGNLNPLNGLYNCLVKHPDIQTDSEFTFGKNKVVVLRID